MASGTLVRAGSALCAAVVVGFTLGCGGISTSVSQSTFIDATVALLPVADSPEKTAVSAMVDEGWLQAGRGEVSMMGPEDFKSAVEEAAEDGTIDAGELAGIKALADTWANPGDVSPGDATLLVEKNTTAIEKQKKNVFNAANDFEDWEYPDGFRKRGEAQGWEVVDCESSVEEEGDWVESYCLFTDGDNTYYVEVTAFKDRVVAVDYEEDFVVGEFNVRSGKSVLRVRVSDVPRARKLAEFLDTKKLRSEVVSLLALKASLKEQGWTASDCDTNEDEELITRQCEVANKSARGNVSIDYWPQDKVGSSPTINTDGGEVRFDYSGVWITVSINDSDLSKAAIKALRTP